MNGLGVILLAVFAVVVVLTSPVIDQGLDAQWKAWKTEYGKKYQIHDEEMRRNNWMMNKLMVEKHNAEESMGYHSYRLGLNEFSDMTDEEFEDTMLMRMDTLEPPKRRMGNSLRKEIHGDAKPKDPVPSYIDYRKTGQVTPVKNQGKCKSSYAFSAVGGIEGLYKSTYNKLVNFSAQNLVDCSSTTGNYGCRGGSPDNAYSYIGSPGLENATIYPYNSSGGRAHKCQFNPAYVQAQLFVWESSTGNTEAVLQQVVAENNVPVSACIDGSRSGFKNYKSGIYYDPGCTKNSTTCVLIVGYNATDTSKAYWILKNSWGTSWGMDGYMYMSMFQNNQCGIASNFSLPVALD